MGAQINPFRELYLTESITPDRFVYLFSPFLVEQALALFEPGHVILKGLPGSGKSMLLSLLKPDVRIAYAKNNIVFPIPKNLNRFIGAGIHLRRSGVSDFGHRPINSDKSFEDSPFYFADFLNYWISLDILESIESLGNKEFNLHEEIGIDLSDEKLDNFTKKIIKDNCWNGYLNHIKSYYELKNELAERINTYRNFLNFNTDSIPESIKTTKTIIGVPMTVLARLLRETRIISERTEIFVRIDQYEELPWIEGLPNHKNNSYQEMIHKLLAMRDTTVSYRLGTRPFTWNERGQIFGTTARLEKGRNYIDVNIDSLLKRKENRRTWIFPDFAEDILRRRLKCFDVNFSYTEEKGSLNLVFGKSGTAQEKVNFYLKTDKSKAIRVEEKWPQEWKNFLYKLVEDDPFSARLAEAWVRQKDKSKQQVMYNIPVKKDFPWNKPYWKKERVAQALLQIASRNNQQPIWYGRDDILSLSGSSILVFLQLCRSIWDVWIRDTGEANDSIGMKPIEPEVQSIGIIEASNAWFEEITWERGGKARKLFINFLGSFFYKKLVEDDAMSNPGNNGFSLDLEELERDDKLKSFLNQATDYGDLYDAPHTSKLKNKKARIKWYLNPMLSPHFKIPSIHTKEPLYTSVVQVKKWLNDALGSESDENSIKKKNKNLNSSNSQLFFDF